MKKSSGDKSINPNIKDSEKNENFNPPIEIPATAFPSCPETCEEMINTYGTYEIQATANSWNDFPMIAQGINEDMKNRPLEFFRGEEDPNPAAKTSDKDCVK